MAKRIYNKDKPTSRIWWYKLKNEEEWHKLEFKNRVRESVVRSNIREKLDVDRVPYGLKVNIGYDGP